MKEFIEVTWSSGSLDEARSISRFLVRERLVACAQIIPWIESIYIWDNQVETTQESKVVLKTTKALFEKVSRVIEEKSSYEIPEITYKHIDGGNSAYLAWLETSVLKECRF